MTFMQDLNPQTCLAKIAKMKKKKHVSEESQKLFIIRFRSLAKELRSKIPNLLFLNAGDSFYGTLWYTLFKWQLVVEVVKQMKFDAMSFGNHEFDSNVTLALTMLCKHLHLEGNVKQYSGLPIILDHTVPGDEEIQKMLAPIAAVIKQKYDSPIGRTAVMLDGDCRRHECNMGNLFADAMVFDALNDATLNDNYGWTQYPAAFVSGGIIRVSIVMSSLKIFC
ncbi:Snake venom 5'-nucleotidase-like protein [Leptotrombidium deliense]|uniref:5'-nucleotidase n=1 Tax=Leptotrombidium deliense TaxID=299467 RepID=A0A443S984_9ACAR|nr:Snake venom 5'-nucleotidase-like protein [Leptotrombidium deliense]